MTKPINTKNQYKKGELILNVAGWPGIIIENTRGNDPEIAMVEIYGFEHESGSIYTREIVARLNIREFQEHKRRLGMQEERQYFTGALIEAK